MEQSWESGVHVQLTYWPLLLSLIALSGCGAESHAGKSEPSKSPARELSIAVANGPS